MSGQQPGLSQPLPRQQSAYDDMQLWQQHLMYKQLQELQRQQQLQQLGQESKQQSSVNQLPALTKQTTVDQIPPHVNGIPPHSISNYSWQNQFTGGDPKTPSNSQMFAVSHMNLPQHSGAPTMHGFSNGVILSNDQPVRSTEFVPQQPDQSLYGMPVSGNRSSLNQYSSFQGMSQNFADMEKSDPNQAGKLPMQPAAFSSSQNNQSLYPDERSLQDSLLASKQDFQGKKFFSHDSVSVGVMGNFQQVNLLARNMQVQGFHDRQDQSDWQGNLPVKETETSQVGPSQSSVGLDPTEQKILFSSDDDFNWGAAFGSGNMSTSGYLNGNPLGGNDLFNTFPSIQSGSWSALMQSAVAEASSSDTGLQDEWSGLSFQKPELLSGSHIISNDTTIRGASSLPSRPIPIFENGGVSTTDHGDPSFQQSSISFSNNQNERVHVDAPQDSLLQLKESSQQLDQSSHKKHGIWTGQFYQQPVSAMHSTEKVELSSQNMQGSFGQQQNMSSYTSNSRLNNKRDDWNINASRPSSSEATFKVSGDESLVQHNQMNDSMKTMHTETDRGVSMWNSDGNQVPVSSPHTVVGSESTKSGHSFPQMRSAAAMISNSSKHNEMNKQGIYRHEVDYGKHVVLDSSLIYKGNENLGNNIQMPNKSLQAWQSSVNNSDKVSGEIYDRKQDHGSQNELSNDSYISNHSHPDHSSDSGSGARDNPHLTGTDSRSFVTSNQKFQGQVDHETPVHRRFFHHPMGNLGFSADVKESQKKGSYVHGQSQMRHVSHSQTNAKGAADLHVRGNTNSQESKVPASFVGQTSQNMLELLHKVDRSRDSDAVTSFGFSDQNTISQMKEATVSDGFNAQHNQSFAPQGFGLRLAPPSQRQSTSNNDLASHMSSQIANDLSAKRHNSELGDKRRMWSNPAVPVQSLPSSHEVYKRYDLDGKPSACGQISKETIESNPQGSSMAGTAGNLYYPSNPLQQQQSSGATGQHSRGQPANMSSAAQFPGAHSTHSSHPSQTNDSHDAAVVSSQPSLSSPGMSSRVPPFRLASPPDNCSLVVSQAESMNIHGQSPPVHETRAVSQPSMSGTSQQGSFSGTLRNVWTNISAHRLSNSLSQNPNLLRSINMSKLGTSSWTQQKINEQDHKSGGSLLSDVGACSVNSQNLTYVEEQAGKINFKQQVSPGNVESSSQTINAPQGQEPIGNQALDANSVVPVSSLVRMHQQERDRHGQNLANNDHMDQTLVSNVAPYSLLQQMQAMRALKTDPGDRVGKRLKGTDSGLDSQQSIGKLPQKFMYGYNNVVRGPVDGELSAVVHRSSFPSDSRMLSFSSEGTEQHNANTNAQVVGREVSCQDLGSSGRIDAQNNPRSASIAPYALPSVGGTDHAQVNPQMTPSWFDQFGNLKNGNILAIYNGLLQKNAKSPAEQYFIAKVSEHIGTYNAVERGKDTGHIAGVWRSTTSTLANEQSSSCQIFPSEVLDPDLVTRSKKRKSTSELLPWHREITRGSHVLQTIRMAEMDWARATNRLIEKVENEAEFSDDGISMFRPRRRLTLTTQLMQQLLPSIPAPIFFEPATTEYESVTYLVAKLGLGDACGLVSCFGKDACEHSDGENMVSGKLKASERWGDQFILKLMENFVGRARRLESDLMRLEKRSSILDVRVECQELDRFSMINRFAKFHGRSQTDGLESSSVSDTSRRVFAHRYVTALLMPGNLPEGVACLSL